MKKLPVFDGKHQSPSLLPGRNRFCGGFFAALILVSALLVSGCDILDKQDINENADTGNPGSIEFKSLTVDDTASATSLFLAFNRDIPGLEADDITITSAPGITVDGLFGDGLGNYILRLSGVKASEKITVEVSKDGYAVSPESLSVNALYNPSIKAKLGITKTGKEGVAATFDALHTFIQGGGLTRYPDMIQTGDWIDLEYGLAVAEYGGSDGSGGGNFSHDAAAAMQAITLEGKPWGTLCRLIVVGVNSFQSGKGSDGKYTITANNGTPHVVFQFQNIPVKRRMNAADTNEGGYAASEMRTYLTEKFLPGLTAAGVPENVLWAPVRYLSAGTNGTGSVPVSDKLWLPTEREMYLNGVINYWSQGYSANGETAANQARLEYYTDRRKISASDSKYPVVDTFCDSWYWESSAYSGGSSAFCVVNQNGNSNYLGASVGGVAPAFCVK